MEYELSIAQERNGDADGCRQSFMAGIDAAKVATELQPSEPDYQFQLANLHVFAATRLEKSGKSAEARPSFDSARNILESLLRSDPDKSRFQKLLDSISVATGD